MIIVEYTDEAMNERIAEHAQWYWRTSQGSDLFRKIPSLRLVLTEQSSTYIFSISDIDTVIN